MVRAAGSCPATTATSPTSSSGELTPSSGSTFPVASSRGASCAGRSGASSHGPRCATATTSAGATCYLVTPNATWCCGRGSITISTRIIKKSITIGQQELPGFVEVRVVDTGIGVSLEQQAKLFKSFSQVDGSRTRQYGGTGMGLVISQTLVEAMGGDVHFYSMGEDLGSTVTFTIPLYQQPVMMAVSEESS